MKRVWIVMIAAMLTTGGWPYHQTEAADPVHDSRNGMVEKYWKLAEVSGKPVPALQGEPYLVLKADGRVIGFTGCSDFAGAYKVDAATAHIAFGQVLSIKVTCPGGAATEKAFLDALWQADNYSLEGGRLILIRARTAPVARFEAGFLN
jgi:heat shock protein HslJ